MAWSASGMFREWPKQAMQVSGTGYTGLDSDTIKAALFNNSVTPDKDAAVGSTGYNTGTWTTGNEVSDGTNWDAAGEPLTSKTFTTPSSGIFRFDAADTPQSGSSCSLSGVYGCFVYDDSITAGTVADQGITFHYFGGAQQVSGGQFNIVWHANGVFQMTM